MTTKINKPIIIFRGDDTSAFNLRTIKIILKGDLDLSDAIAKFTLLDYHKEWTIQEVASGELSMSFSSTDTKAMPLGEQTGTFRLYDMSTGEPRQLTIVNKIPFLVTNRVCELDNESYHADVSVASGEIISIEFNVGVGAVNGKADKVKNAVNGDLAGLDSEGNLTDSDIPASDVLRKSQMDSTPTAGSLNPVTSDGVKQAIDAATPSDYEQVKSQVEQNTTDITAIESKIPSQASAQNQLADKDFVNSSIATNTATFRGSYNAYSELGVSPPYPLTPQGKSAIATAITAKLASLMPPVVPENNDYCFVQIPRNTQAPAEFDPMVIERIDRYKCTVTELDGAKTRVWDYEWSLNNSSFTAKQWAAINSGITSELVTKLGALPTADELAASLLAKYEKPNTGIPKTDLSAGVQASLDKADTALQTAPVTKVNNKTGEVTLTAGDVGALGNSGDQTLNGTLSVKHTRIEEHKIVYDVDAAGESNLKFPAGQNDYLAVLSDIYAVVQQIAPDFTAKTYALNELCTYNGVVYRCKSAYTATASSAKPINDTTHWEAKKVSELFVPWVDGNIFLDGTKCVSVGGDDAGSTKYRYGKIFHDSLYEILLPSAFGTIALLENLAPAFSTSVTYEVNKLCVYNKVLYRCTTAITTAGAWDYSKWTMATVQDVLAAIWTAMALKAPLASPAFTDTPTAPTPTAGDNSTKVATTAFVQGAVAGVPLRYDMPTAVALVAENDAATLVCADRAVTNATIAAGFSTLNLTFPEAISGKVRDFYLRITVAAGESAPALSIPQGITIENPDGAVPEIADGKTSAASTTLVWFSETAPNVFTAKSETVKAVA